MLLSLLESLKWIVFLLIWGQNIYLSSYFSCLFTPSSKSLKLSEFLRWSNVIHFLMSVSFICLYQTLRSFFTVIPLLLHKPEKKNTRLWLTFHVLGSLSYIVSCRWGYKGSISRHHSNVTIAWNTFLSVLQPHHI